MRRVVFVILSAAVLSGCAAKVLSTSERSVVIFAYPRQVGEAQVQAQAECSKYSRSARMSMKASENQYVFDCVL